MGKTMSFTRLLRADRCELHLCRRLVFVLSFGLLALPVHAQVEPCYGIFDVDQSGVVDNSDSLMIFRATLGQPAANLRNLVGRSAARSDVNEIRDYILTLSENHVLDIDGDGVVQPYQDVVLLYRFLQYNLDSATLGRLLGSNAVRDSYNEIAAYITAHTLTSNTHGGPGEAGGLFCGP